MAGDENWVDVGATDELSRTPLRHVTVAQRELAISFKDGTFGVVSNVCNHVGGPLGEGRLDGDYIVCPWHNWKFHRCSGVGEPGFEEDRVPPIRSRSRTAACSSTSQPPPSAPRSRTRRIRWHAKSSARPGRCALAGISTSAMDAEPTRAFPAPTICSITR